MHRMALVKTLMIIVVLGIFSALMGCGSGSTQVAETGRAAFTVLWSATGRAALDAAGNSVRITLADNGTAGTSRLVTRPANNSSSSTIVFENLSPQTHTFTASSYTSADGTGTPLAMAQTTVTITKGKTADIKLTTVPTVQSVTPVPGQAALAAGHQAIISTTVLASDGSIVLIPAGNLQWVSSNPDVVQLTVQQGQATLTAMKAGTATVTVTETTSGKSGMLPVTVSAAPSAPGTTTEPTTPVTTPTTPTDPGAKPTGTGNLIVTFQ